MENQAGAAPEKKKRPRIQRPVARPTSQTFSQTVVTTPYSRQNMAKTKPVDEISFMESLLKDAEAVCRKSPAAVKALLVKIAPKSEKDRLQNKLSNCNSERRLALIVGKYKGALERRYVCSAAEQDVQNLLSANPKALPSRPSAVRLECMEQLWRKAEAGEIRAEQYEYLHQTYFKDIVSRDNLPEAQASKMLRAMAAGKFYFPKGSDGKINKKQLSPAFLKVLERKRLPKISAKIEDYDFFGVDEKGQPLCPIWYAVKDSANFQKLKNVVAEKCIQKGIDPKTAYEFVPGDYWCMFAKENSKQPVQFSDICMDVHDAPYEEFAQKFGMILSVGGAQELSYAQKQKFWLNNFASETEKDDFEYGNKVDLEIFIRQCENIYQKLDEDFKENGINPAFIGLWAESMIENKSVNPDYVKCNGKPYKIDIHHGDRLSSVKDYDKAAQKNNLDHLSLMIMYHEYSFDIHAFQHKNESAHFIIVDEQDKVADENMMYLFATSNCVYGRSDLMKNASDYCPKKQSGKILTMESKQRA